MILQAIRRLLATRSSFPVPAMVRRPLKPMWVDPDGIAHIRPEMIRRLEHLHSLGTYYRERMEAAEFECCELLGCDPEADCNESDWAREIVAFGIEVPIAIGRIEKLRAEEQDSKYYSQPENA